MKTLQSCIDIDFQEIKQSRYDLAIMTCGYEERCTSVARELQRANLATALVWMFDGLQNDVVRKANERYFLEEFRPNGILKMSYIEDSTIYYDLRERITSLGKHLKILVDYSSMSRLWYAAILNLIRYSDSLESVEIDFVYRLGRRPKPNDAYYVDSTFAIPGFEGKLNSGLPSVMLLGIGMNGLAAQYVVEDFEPDEIRVWRGGPDIDADYTMKVNKANNYLLEHCAEVISLPILSVERSVRLLGELVKPLLPGNDIVLFPMGTKPHVLAALFLCMKYPDVGCYYASVKRDHPESVLDSGITVATRMKWLMAGAQEKPEAGPIKRDERS